jgi:hypothetical protein
MAAADVFMDSLTLMRELNIRDCFTTDHHFQ